MYRNLVRVKFDSLSRWESVGMKALGREARNNSPGFSPLSRQATSQFVKAVDACEEFLNGLRAEARSNVVVAICAQALSPSLSQRKSQTVPLPEIFFVYGCV
jgi:hypothetical protein